MLKYQQCEGAPLFRAIQLAPRFHPKISTILEAENGFIVHLSGGEKREVPPSFQRSLVAKSRKEALTIAEEFLKD